MLYLLSPRVTLLAGHSGLQGVLPEITFISFMLGVILSALRKASKLWAQLIQLERKSCRLQSRNKWALSVFLDSLDHDKSVRFNLYRTWNGNAKAYWRVDNIQTGTRCAGCSVYCSGPLAAAILSSQCDMEPNHRYALRERERESGHAWPFCVSQ